MLQLKNIFLKLAAQALRVSKTYTWVSDPTLRFSSTSINSYKLYTFLISFVALLLYRTKIFLKLATPPLRLVETHFKGLLSENHMSFCWYVNFDSLSTDSYNSLRSKSQDFTWNSHREHSHNLLYFVILRYKNCYFSTFIIPIYFYATLTPIMIWKISKGTRSRTSQVSRIIEEIFPVLHRLKCRDNVKIVFRVGTPDFRVVTPADR